MTTFALSTLNQGLGYLAFTSVTQTSGVAWIVGGVFEVHDLSVNQQLMGASNSTQNALRVYPDGSIAMRSSAVDRIRSAPGKIQVDVPFHWEVRNNVATGHWELYIDDMDVPVGTFARGSTAWGMNQLGRFSTTAVTPLTVYNFYFAGEINYTERWDATTAIGSGTVWDGVNNSRTLTLLGATGAEDSWWIPASTITATGNIAALYARVDYPAAINLDLYFDGATEYAVQSGNLPNGLSIVGSQIVGTCTAAQTTTLAIRASNATDFVDSVLITFKCEGNLTALHPEFTGRVVTDDTTSLRGFGLVTQLESLYLFNGDADSNPAVVPNLIQNKHHIDMTWAGAGRMLGNGGARFADNGNAVTNTAGVFRDIDTAWSDSKQGKSRLFVLQMEWKNQPAIGQCFPLSGPGMRFFRGAAGTIFNIWLENMSSHALRWTVDTASWADGDSITLVVAADMRIGMTTSRCFINGVDLGVGVLNGDPYNAGSSKPATLNANYIGRTSYTNYYGFDGKIGLFAHSFELTNNALPTLSQLQELSVDPYRVLLTTESATTTYAFVVAVAAQALSEAGFMKLAVASAVEGALADHTATFTKRATLAATESAQVADNGVAKKVALQPVSNSVTVSAQLSRTKVGAMPLAAGGQTTDNATYTKVGKMPVAIAATTSTSVAAKKVGRLVASEAVALAMAAAFKKVSGFAVAEGATTTPYSDADKIGRMPVAVGATVTVVAAFVRQMDGLEIQEALTAAVAATVQKVGRAVVQIHANMSDNAALVKVTGVAVSEAATAGHTATSKKVGRSAVAEQMLAGVAANATKIAKQIVGVTAVASSASVYTKVGVEEVSLTAVATSAVVLRKRGSMTVAEGAAAHVASALKKYGRLAVLEEVQAGVSATFYQHFEGIMQLSETVLAGFDLSFAKVGSSPVASEGVADTDSTFVKIGSLIVAEYSIAEGRVVTVDAEIPVYVARVSGKGSAAVPSGKGGRSVIYGRSNK